MNFLPLLTLGLSASIGYLINGEYGAAVGFTIIGLFVVVINLQKRL